MLECDFCWNVLQALQNDLEELPEDDEDDIDFTLDGLLAPMESDAEDHAPPPEPVRSHAQAKSIAKRARRCAGSQDQQRWAAPLHTNSPVWHALWPCYSRACYASGPFTSKHKAHCCMLQSTTAMPDILLSSAIHEPELTHEWVLSVGRRLPVLLSNDSVHGEVLGMPACDFMADDQHQAAPAVAEEPDTSPQQQVAQPLTDYLWVDEPDYSPRGFDADQIKQLYSQLNHHCQLIIEVYALTACNSSQQETATQLGSLLSEFQVSNGFTSCTSSLTAQ